MKVTNKKTKEVFWDDDNAPHIALFEAQDRGWTDKIKIQVYINIKGVKALVSQWDWDSKLTFDQNLEEDRKKERAVE